MKQLRMHIEINAGVHLSPLTVQPYPAKGSSFSL